jgi:hypothetical protein
VLLLQLSFLAVFIYSFPLCFGFLCHFFSILSYILLFFSLFKFIFFCFDFLTLSSSVIFFFFQQFLTVFSSSFIFLKSPNIKSPNFAPIFT